MCVFPFFGFIEITATLSPFDDSNGDFFVSEGSDDGSRPYPDALVRNITDRAMYSLAQSGVKNKPGLWQSSAKKSKYDEEGLRSLTIFLTCYSRVCARSG
ncbi:unnamed protein product [Eruca vesicaria subsp. sativa]|uniref:Uncharacterized protein n=1 Tax=Eruca vesicaria subsp. sativa TaxID=29727 RepID=A0ABC8J3S9_ERUVS|nr:unnamed protein product [Eruca vesicaria subsp. sativa]